MKLVIAVFTCTKSPYPELLQAAKETWAGTYNPDVLTFFFYGTDKLHIKECNNCFEVGLECSDEYNMQHWKFKKFIDFIDSFKAFNYDFILRGSQSSYFDKDLALKKCYKLPKEKCYCGLDGGDFASGCGHFISKDVATILKNNITNAPNPHEDLLMAEILHHHNIGITKGAERFDFKTEEDEFPTELYHYRCKLNAENRTHDIKIFNRIYQSKEILKQLTNIVTGNA